MFSLPKFLLFFYRITDQVITHLSIVSYVHIFNLSLRMEVKCALKEKFLVWFFLKIQFISTWCSLLVPNFWMFLNWYDEPLSNSNNGMVRNNLFHGLYFMSNLKESNNYFLKDWIRDISTQHLNLHSINRKIFSY